MFLSNQFEQCLFRINLSLVQNNLNNVGCFVNQVSVSLASGVICQLSKFVQAVDLALQWQQVNLFKRWFKKLMILMICLHNRIRWRRRSFFFQILIAMLMLKDPHCFSFVAILNGNRKANRLESILTLSIITVIGGYKLIYFRNYGNFKYIK